MSLGRPPDAPIADAKLHKMQSGDFAAEFPLQWALKDVDLAISAEGDDRLPLLQALSRQWHAAVDAGPGRQMSARRDWRWEIGWRHPVAERGSRRVAPGGAVLL